MGKVKIGKAFIAKNLSQDFIGDGNTIIEYISNLDSTDEKCIAFYKGDDINTLCKLSSGVLIVKESFRAKLSGDFNAKCIFFAQNPMLTFSKFVNTVFPDEFNDTINNKREGNKISEHAYIEQNVILGEKNVIFPNVTIFDGAEIGNACKIQSGTVIGASGMSYTKDENGEFYKLNQVGKIIIHDNVDIGSNSTVMKGILEATIIREGSKIGNHVNVGHNCTIGKRCYISAGVMIGGATSIGDDCWIAPGVSIRDNITIGENCTIGVGSVVVKSTEPNAVYYGNPARLAKYK